MRAREYISFSLYLSFVFANDLDFNAAINTSYGNNYDFYNYSENVLDINFL